MNTKYNAKIMGGLFGLSALFAYIAWQADTNSTSLELQLANAEAQIETAAAEATPPPASTLTGGVVRLAAASQRAPASRKAIISQLAEGANAFVGYLEIEGGAGVPEHRDPTEEYIYVLEGGGTISIDDQSFQIGPGDTVFMPANAKVSFANGDATMRAIQVFSGPESAKKYDAWPAVETTTTSGG